LTFEGGESAVNVGALLSGGLARILQLCIHNAPLLPRNYDASESDKHTRYGNSERILFELTSALVLLIVAVELITWWWFIARRRRDVTALVAAVLVWLMACALLWHGLTLLSEALPL
jgi:hypothetical protein